MIIKKWANDNVCQVQRCQGWGVNDPLGGKN
jgi:hypothetical protein